MRQKHVSKSVHVEAALFGEDIESILKLILKFTILAKPNQQNTSNLLQKMNEQLYVLSLFFGGHSSPYLICSSAGTLHRI